MKYLVGRETMQKMELCTEDKFMVSGTILMERAALALVEEMERVFVEKDKQQIRILTVCGTGKNGGDGAAAARILTERGYKADILVLGDEKRSVEAAKLQFQIARNYGVRILNNAKISEYNVVIDAIFGTGLTKPVGGVFEETIQEINISRNLVFSVDVPSGVICDNGRVENLAVHADYTVTFGYLKIGLMLYPGKEYAGNVILRSIGIPQKVEEATQFPAFIYEPEDIRLLPKRRAYSNKGNYGRVLVIAGARNVAGACFLSAKAACRSGAGLVKVMTVTDNREVMQSSLPEAILTTYDPQNIKNKAEIERIAAELIWADAIVIGPGMGINTASKYLLDLVIENAGQRPVVADADALHIMAQDDRYVARHAENENFNKLYLESNLILTPHLKEMSDLMDSPVEVIQDNLLNTALTATKGKKFTLVLKDARSVITDGMRVCINNSGNNGMATAGSGDVLTGIIAALLAQGMKQFEAAALGAYIHGLAGDKAAEKKGYYGMIAGDIIEALPEVLR